MAGANTSTDPDDIRVGLNIGYHAAWWNSRVRAGADSVYPPIEEAVYCRMPVDFRILLYGGAPQMDGPDGWTTQMGGPRL